MTETLAVPSDAPVETASSPKKNKGKAKSGTKKVAAKSTVKAKPSEHPPTSEMVNSAIEELNEKGGSSLQAIKKFIGANYKIDLSKANIFIRKYLVSAVTSGKLVRTKGTGASGSFKLPGPSVPTKGKRTPVRKVRNTATKKEIAVKKVTPTKVKKSPKKKTVSKKSKPVKAAKVSAKPTPKKLKASAAKPKKPAAKKPIKAAASKKKSTPKKKK